MDFLQSVFNGGTLNFEQFQQACSDAGFKLVDLSGGGYVAKKKYTDDLTAKDSQITALNDALSARDTDLQSVRQQLETAGADQSKLESVQKQLNDLQAKYEDDTKQYQERLQAQAYEFAVRDYAGQKKFSSEAAKRDFISAMKEKKLTMEQGTILGADDFAAEYRKENDDAFLPDEGQKAPPKFVSPGGGNSNPQKNLFDFHFTGVRQPK